MARSWLGGAVDLSLAAKHLKELDTYSRHALLSTTSKYPQVDEENDDERNHDNDE